MKWIFCTKDQTGELYQFLYNEDEEKPEIPEGFTFVEEGEDVIQDGEIQNETIDNNPMLQPEGQDLDLP